MDQESAKKRRRVLYRQAKERRDKDPRYIAFKEKQKMYRKAQRQKVKEKKQLEKLKVLALKQSAKEQALKIFFKSAVGLNNHGADSRFLDSERPSDPSKSR